MKKDSVAKVLLFIFRLLFGAVFIFSGFVKAVDPLGFAYKIEDYLIAAGPFFEHFSSFALPIAIVLASVEFLIGVSILFGVRLKEASILGFLFMLVMTPLTLWVALKNPVTDCGCFGDALIIGNWTTFWKNVVLLTLLIAIMFLQKLYRSVLRPSSQWILVVYTFLFAVGFSLYCYMHLPLIDFRPYKIGANILEGMKIPEGAPMDEYNTTFIYAKNGVEKEFTLENYPKNDSTWKFVDQKSVLIKKGYTPPIHDFTIDMPEVGDVAEDVLNDGRYTFLLTSQDIASANLKDIDKINRLYDYCLENNYPFYCLTSSSQEDIAVFRAKTNAKYPIALTDKITLKTMIRSNPGLLLIKDATVLNNWYATKMPTFNKPLAGSKEGQIRGVNNTEQILFMIMLFAFPLVLIYGLDKQWRGVKRD